MLIVVATTLIAKSKWYFVMKGRPNVPISSIRCQQRPSCIFSSTAAFVNPHPLWPSWTPSFWMLFSCHCLYWLTLCRYFDGEAIKLDLSLFSIHIIRSLILITQERILFFQFSAFFFFRKETSSWRVIYSLRRLSLYDPILVRLPDYQPLPWFPSTVCRVLSGNYPHTSPLLEILIR